MTADRTLIRRYLNTWYGGLPDGLYLTVNAAFAQGMISAHFPSADLDSAADRAAVWAQLTDVYITCCPLGLKPALGERGSGDHAGAMVGLWSDLDVAGPGHKRPHDGLPLPPDRASAQQVISDVGLAPTAVVDSGGGLYAWWLLDEPWVFADDTDRTRAADLSTRFGATLVEYGQRKGWHVDDVSDLARILRPVGAINRKPAQPPIPVRLVEADRNARYTVAELEQVILDLPKPASPPRQPRPERQSNSGKTSPAAAIAEHLSWADILEPHGWTLVKRGRRKDGADLWRHPNASHQMSATTDAYGVPTLVNFSESNPGGLPSGKGHNLTKFRVWATLNYGHTGDPEGEAARALRRWANDQQAVA